MADADSSVAASPREVRSRAGPRKRSRMTVRTASEEKKPPFSEPSQARFAAKLLFCTMRARAPKTISAKEAQSARAPSTRPGSAIGNAGSSRTAT